MSASPKPMKFHRLPVEFPTANSRAKTNLDMEGFVKILMEKETDRIETTTVTPSAMLM